MPDTEPLPAIEDATGRYFQLLNEIGIIAQLSRAAFEAANAGRVTLPQFTVLNHLVRVGDGKPPQDLARAFQVPRASMTNTLQGLEIRGLIETGRNPKDGRSKHVFITPAGRSMREGCIARVGKAFDALAADFPPSEIDGVLPALTRLRETLDRQRE